jgi:nitrate/TMAO reductase-like tetraheme cytochrome c subunit
MRLPQSFHNWISYVGAALAALAFAVFVFLFVFHSLSAPNRVPYAGLVIFILVPAFILLGLALIPVGMVIEWIHWRRTGRRSIPRLPTIDLNNATHRNATFVFLVGSLVLIFFSAYGGYRAYQYTDSVTFCGQLCHSVMQPEFTSHEDSPHAQVKCVGCHVGPGASWYVRSKLSGLYQVYATVFDKYPRPIPGTITDLRPAREVCEQCHWPRAFWGGKEESKSFFLSDEQNSRWNVNMLLKVGGRTPETATAEGIHWHVARNVRVEYIATDHARQTIPWVRVTDLTTGKTVVYESTDSPLTDEQRATAQIRTMDCMDCHNRPSHDYLSPVASMNLALAGGRISPSLPFIKQEGVQVLSRTYGSDAEALRRIEHDIDGYYQKKFPTIASAHKDDVAAAVHQLQGIYEENFFPTMKVQWTEYPDNAGHWIFPGCMRCHDGTHRSADGRVVPRDCNTCHTILSQGKPGQEEYTKTDAGLEFHHPVPIDEAWRDTPCTECHTGGA